jgi:hypothetical protein
MIIEPICPKCEGIFTRKWAMPSSDTCRISHGCFGLPENVSDKKCHG